MIFVSHYDSPLGILYLAADEEALKGVWFEGQKYFASGLKENGTEEKETPVLKRTREWLDLYFAGKDPEFLPPLAPDGSEFRKELLDQARLIDIVKSILTDLFKIIDANRQF